MSYSGGEISVQNSTPTANARSKTEVLMLGDVTGPDGADSSARNLVVRATGNDRSVAGADSKGLGKVQVGIANVKANTKPTVNAQIGGLVQVTNDISVIADSRTDADTTNDSASGGGVAVSVLNADVTLTPTVTALVAGEARLDAGNNITIVAVHGKTAPTFAPVLNSDQTPPASDRVAKSAAVGASGGLIQVGVVTTTLTARPNVSMTVNAGAELSAIRNIDIQSKAIGKVSAIAEGDGGGVIAVGISNSDVILKPTSELKINSDAVINATGNEIGTMTGSITVISTTSADAFAKGRGVSGGLVAGAGATVTTNVSHASTVDIGEFAQLTTNGVLKVESLSDVKAVADSSVTAGGGIAVADNTTTLKLGSAAIPATTTTSVGSNALLQGADVTIGARVPKLDLKVDADIEADGVGSGSNAKALMTIHDKTEVSLAQNASVTGDTVTITSAHDDDIENQLFSKAEATSYAVIGIPDADAKVDFNGISRVFSDSGALVSGRVVNVNATQPADYRMRTAREYAWQNGIGGDPGERSGAYNATSEIEWNGNVVLLSGPDPELIVSDTGVITKAIGVSVGGKGELETISGGIVSVDPINNTNSSVDAVTFTADTVIGDGGTISAATAFRSVKITNLFAGPLTINGINVVKEGAAPTVYLNILDPTKKDDFKFKVGSEVSPTEITIDNQGANSNVLLNAPNVLPGTTQGFTIYNPRGTTTIVAAHGSIFNDVSTPQTPTVWTRALDLQSAGSVGTGSSRLNVDLVRSSGQTGLNVEAGKVQPAPQVVLSPPPSNDVFLDLRGRLRATNVGNSIFRGGIIQTPGNIDLLLESAVQDSPSSPTLPKIAVERYVNTVLDPILSDAFGIPTYTESPVAGTYQFDQLIAGADSGNITINAVNAANTSANLLVNFASGTDMGNTSGELLAAINGDLTLSERNGDFRIRNVSSSAGNVSLATTGDGGSIYDLDNTEATPYGTTAWVTGNSVTLRSRDGGIGSATDFLEIDSSNQATGAVIALAKKWRLPDGDHGRAEYRQGALAILRHRLDCPVGLDFGIGR